MALYCRSGERPRETRARCGRDARSPLLLTLPASMRPFLLLFLIPVTANAWKPIADHQIADRAARLAPRDLNLIIKRMHHRYAAGIDYGISEERGDPHRVQLRERIERETRGVIGMIRTNQPMAQIVT